MFNISENTIITGLKKTGCTKGHIIHCLHVANKHEKPEYSYYGKIVSKGTVLLHTCKGDFTLKFDEKNGWARYVEIL